jgi:hypothetical protein
MANQWFRSWHGAPTNPKWGLIGRKVNLPHGMVFAIAWALFDRASQAEERGSIDGYDPEELAYVMGCDAEDIDAVVSAMRDKGMIEGHAVSAWEKHQPKREDNSAERVKAHRKRKAGQRNAGVTQGNAPDKDTDKDTEPSKEGGSAQAREPSPQGAFDYFVWAVNVKGRNIPTPHQLSKDRKTKIAARLNESGFDKWKLACDKLAVSDFCNGQNDRGWIANLDFMLQPSRFNKLIEGAYDNRPPQGAGPPDNGYVSLADQMRNQSQPPEDLNEWQPETKYLTGS